MWGIPSLKPEFEATPLKGVITTIRLKRTIVYIRQHQVFRFEGSLRGVNLWSDLGRASLCFLLGF